MTLGYNEPLYILAFDHRTSFQTKLFGIAGTPSEAEREQMRRAKEIIAEGLLIAAAHAPAGAVTALTDEELGFAAARRVKQAGLQLAICAEKSSQAEFDLEYGDDFATHIERFDPNFIKILARYNVDGDREMNLRQAERLARFSEWIGARPNKFLFELIVPPTADALAQVGSDLDRYANELRPALTARAITELQDRGVEPDIWKLEGLDTTADCGLVADAATRDGRDAVGCVILGAGAPQATVDHWLRVASQAQGFVGFAIGRTIWWDALAGWIEGRLSAEDAARQISESYLRSVSIFTRAGGSVLPR